MSAALASCPGCGHETLLVSAVAMAQLTQKGIAAPWWGVPMHGLVYKNAVVECNRTECGWTGTVKEARGG